MTGFKRNGEWLDFAGALGLELRSPLFDTESIPGVLSYPAAFDDTPHNRRLLDYPAVRSRVLGPAPALDVDYYIGGLRWRTGVLKYQGYDSTKRQYTYQFQADADALATRLDGVKLPALALPTLPLQLEVETADYVLFPVRNRAFYDAEKNPDFVGVVNYVDPLGVVKTNTGLQHLFTATPFLKVVPLLRRALGLYGYSLNGAWVDDPEIQQLTIYSTRALDQVVGPAPATEFSMADLLPDVGLADLLIVLQKLFCLGYVFHPVRREITIVPLRDVAANPAYTKRRARAGFTEQANQSDGFLLRFAKDEADELIKNFTWVEQRVGNGKEVIEASADPLLVAIEPDPHFPARSWMVPCTEQQGQSPRADFGQEKNRASHLRFLFYRGMQPDSNGALYPLGSAGVHNYVGTIVGNYALQWDGPAGLYEQWHKPWLDFRALARKEQRTVRLSVEEFSLLDPCRKDMVERLKFLWESISISAGGDGALADARITYHQIAQ